MKLVGKKKKTSPVSIYLGNYPTYWKSETSIIKKSEFRSVKIGDPISGIFNYMRSNHCYAKYSWLGADNLTSVRINDHCKTGMRASSTLSSTIRGFRCISVVSQYIHPLQSCGWQQEVLGEFHQVQVMQSLDNPTVTCKYRTWLVLSTEYEFVSGSS